MSETMVTSGITLGVRIERNITGSFNTIVTDSLIGW